MTFKGIRHTNYNIQYTYIVPIYTYIYPRYLTVQEALFVFGRFGLLSASYNYG